jgi:tetratricopeptide (TPR) repeat protein
MAEVAFLQERWSAAEAYAFRALDYDRTNMRASRLLVILYRVQKKSEEALSAVAHLKAIDPLSHQANFEQYLLDRSDESLRAFRSLIRCELPAESYLELASVYLGLKRYDDAVLVLQHAPGHPMVYYWLAYLTDLMGQAQQSSDYLAKALDQSAAYVFPFRWESAEILSWADRKAPNWKTKYFLGLLLWSKDKTDAAREQFAACGNQPTFASFYVTRGNFLRSDHSEDALQDYKKALAIGPNEWRPYRALADFLTGESRYAEALEVAKSAAKKFPSSYVALFDLARSYVLNREYAASLKILDTLTVLPFEGARYTREVYRQACVLAAAEEMKSGGYAKAIKMLTKARQWPERLGVGRPYDVDNRLEDYLEGLCAKKTGDTPGARKLFEQIVGYTKATPGDVSVYRLFDALAHRELGNQDLPGKSMEGSLKEGNSPVARWSAAVAAKNAGEAASIEKELRGALSVSLLGRASLDQDFALVAEVYALTGY